MLKSGAHVKIGNYEYLLDEAVEGHYQHSMALPELGFQGVEGQEGKASLSGRLLWSIDDWVGGEGNRLYYPDEPAKYYYGHNLNGRNRGVITGRPSRTLSTWTTLDVRTKVHLTQAGGLLWAVYGFGDDFENSVNNQVEARWSVDGLTWSSPITLWNDIDGFVSAVAGDHRYLYLSYAGTYLSTNTLRGILRIDRQNGAFVTEELFAGESFDTQPYAGMAVLGGYLYAWDGTHLYKIEPTVYGGKTEVSPSVFPDLTYWGQDTLWWADVIAAENSVVCFTTTDGGSSVFEYNEEKGFAPLWSPPKGFSVRSISYLNGFVYCLGTWGTGASSTNQQGALYKISLDTREATFAAWLRKGLEDLFMEGATPSFGNQLLVSASKQGKLFVYDADYEAISLLDDLGTADSASFDNNTDDTSFTIGSHKISSSAAFAGRRIFAISRPGKNLVTFGQWQGDSNYTGTVYLPVRTETANVTVASKDATQAWNGTYGTKITRTSGTGDLNVVFDSMTGTSPRRLSVLPGQAYVASLYFRANSTTRSCRLLLRWYGYDGTLISTTTGGSSSNSNSAWTRISATATPPNGAVAMSVVAEILAVASGEIHFVDGLQVELGSSPTTWEATNGTIQILAYEDDELENRQLSNATTILRSSFFSPEHDFGLPYDGKMFHGTHIAWEVEDPDTPSGLLEAQTIGVFGIFDGDTEVALANIGYDTVPSSGIKGRTFVPWDVDFWSGSKTFFKMRARVYLYGEEDVALNPGYPQPSLWAATFECSPAGYEETWELVVRVKEEQPSTRPSQRLLSASKLRDYLETLKTNRTIVTFLDGTRYRELGRYTTHKVFVQSIQDSIDRNAEGSLRLTLRAVTV